MTPKNFSMTNQWVIATYNYGRLGGLAVNSLSTSYLYLVHPTRSKSSATPFDKETRNLGTMAYQLLVLPMLKKLKVKFRPPSLELH